MEDILIKSIRINRLRHLVDVIIPISETERKHLILTGKNGSGKTSVLQSIKNYLWALENYFLIDKSSINNHLGILYNQINGLENSIKNQVGYWNNNTGQTLNEYQLNAWNRELNALNLEKDFLYSILNGQLSVDLTLTLNIEDLRNNFYRGAIFSTYSDAKRLSVLDRPKGINPINSNTFNSIKSRIGVNIIQYMLNLQTELVYSEKEKDVEKVKNINIWFQKFETGLKSIFEDDDLRVIFIRKGYRFDIVQGNGRIVDFYSLSDGFSAFFSILSELLIRIDTLCELRVKLL